MPRQPPDALVYYLDANLDGPDLVRRLREAGVRCEPHRDHFAQDEQDETWLPAVAARGWVIVTRDFAIQRRPAERAAWIGRVRSSSWYATTSSARSIWPARWWPRTVAVASIASSRSGRRQ